MKISLLSILCILGITVQAQIDRKIILTHENMDRLQVVDTSIAQNMAMVEMKIDSIVGRTTTLTEKRIPVVFHIIYDRPHKKVSQGKVLSQLASLNRDFGTFVPGFQHPAFDRDNISEKITDPQIGFCYPDFLQSGNSDSVAINYHQIDREAWLPNDAMKNPDSLGVAPWSPDKYLNIWVVDLADSLSGYAQMPGGPAATDGIVIDYRFFGTIGTVAPNYDQGKTLTHLVGNYLGLYSLWGTTPCADDGVFDTPIHNAPTVKCPGYYHLSLCDGNPVEMFMNFMDSTPDDCQNMFTLGQKLRMHAVLHPAGPRAGLLYAPLDCPNNQENVVESDIIVTPEERKGRISVFPNPANDIVQIHFLEDIGEHITVRLTNQIGRQVLQRTGISARQGTVSIGIADLPPGSYVLLLERESEILDRYRIIIAH